MTKSTLHIINSMLATHDSADFFGVSQKVFDSVWGALTAESGNSVAYISMEIGADPDVYNPIRDKLLQMPLTGKVERKAKVFIDKFLDGPQKIPNYGGGLGILAGDTLKSFADCKLPVVAVSLLYRRGYFSQLVDSQIGQICRNVDWHPEDTPGLYLLKTPGAPEIPLQIKLPFTTPTDDELIVTAQLWMKMEVNHSLDYFIPELLLDFFLPENPESIQSAAAQLYNSYSSMTKAIQRRLLGSGILPALRALGITPNTFHLNEQHGVVLAMQLISEQLQELYEITEQGTYSRQQILAAAEGVADKLVYTIHTPVRAGHDRFSKSLYSEICTAGCRQILDVLAGDDEQPEYYNFTNMAMRVNRFANSVSRLHRDVTHAQFPQFSEKISAITNGVHHLSWISNERAAVFDAFPQLENWRQDPGVFGRADSLLSDEPFRAMFWKAWTNDTTTLVDYVNTMLHQHRNQMSSTWLDPPNYLSTILDTNVRILPSVFTFGFARRFSTYKRADLIFHDLDMLCRIIVENGWPVNFLFAGKAHPADEPGQLMLRELLKCQEELHHKSQGLANLIFIPDYDMKIAKMLVCGVHAWLNCPKRPLEASGTSGMKAAMNGVPNISIMDGWWVEGYHLGATGWKFGHEGPIDGDSLSESREELLYFEDSSAFYTLLPEVLKGFYDGGSRTVFIDKGIQNLIMNVPIFNTHRMAAEYLQRYQLNLPGKQNKEMAGFAELYSSDI